MMGGCEEWFWCLMAGSCRQRELRRGWRTGEAWATFRFGKHFYMPDILHNVEDHDAYVNLVYYMKFE
jgi:hypothetical protein